MLHFPHLSSPNSVIARVSASQLPFGTTMTKVYKKTSFSIR